MILLGPCSPGDAHRAPAQNNTGFKKQGAGERTLLSPPAPLETPTEAALTRLIFISYRRDQLRVGLTPVPEQEGRRPLLVLGTVRRKSEHQDKSPEKDSLWVLAFEHM